MNVNARLTTVGRFLTTLLVAGCGTADKSTAAPSPEQEATDACRQFFEATRSGLAMQANLAALKGAGSNPAQLGAQRLVLNHFETALCPRVLQLKKERRACSDAFDDLLTHYDDTAKSRVSTTSAWEAEFNAGIAAMEAARLEGIVCAGSPLPSSVGFSARGAADQPDASPALPLVAPTGTMKL